MITYNGPGRELCLTLAKLCEATLNWEGAHILRRAAGHLYRQMRLA
jgi:hypothetical protein